MERQNELTKTAHIPALRNEYGIANERSEKVARQVLPACDHHSARTAILLSSAPPSAPGAGDYSRLADEGEHAGGGRAKDEKGFPRYRFPCLPRYRSSPLFPSCPMPISCRSSSRPSSRFIRLVFIVSPHPSLLTPYRLPRARGYPMREEQAWMRTGQDTRQTRPQRTDETKNGGTQYDTGKERRNRTSEETGRNGVHISPSLLANLLAPASRYSSRHSHVICLLICLIIIVPSFIISSRLPSRFSSCHSSRLVKPIRIIRHGMARHGMAYDERRASRNGASSNTIAHGISEQAGYRTERKTARRAKTQGKNARARRKSETQERTDKTERKDGIQDGTQTPNTRRKGKTASGKQGEMAPIRKSGRAPQISNENGTQDETKRQDGI